MNTFANEITASNDAAVEYNQTLTKVITEVVNGDNSTPDIIFRTIAAVDLQIKIVQQAISVLEILFTLSKEENLTLITWFEIVKEYTVKGVSSEFDNIPEVLHFANNINNYDMGEIEEYFDSTAKPAVESMGPLTIEYMKMSIDVLELLRQEIRSRLPVLKSV